jgi:hypothetical protein
LSGDDTVPITVVAARLGPLAEQQADAAGRGMEQDGVALLDPRLDGAVDQVLGGHALQHHRRRLLVAHALGHLHELRRADQALLAIGAELAAIGDPVALLEALHLGADLDDHAGALAADRVGHRRLVEPERV